MGYCIVKQTALYLQRDSQNKLKPLNYQNYEEDFFIIHY